MGAEESGLAVNDFIGQLYTGLGYTKDAEGNWTYGTTNADGTVTTPTSGTGALAGLFDLTNPADYSGVTSTLGSLTTDASGVTSISGGLSDISPTLTTKETPTLTAGTTAPTSNLGGLISTIGTQASGTDPRFSAYRDAQLNQLRSQEQQALSRESEYFSRRGLAGTSAELNQQGRTQQGYQQQASTLGASLDMQALQNQQAQQQYLGNLLGTQYSQNLAGRQQQFGEEQAAASHKLAALNALFSQQQGAYATNLAGRQAKFGQDVTIANLGAAEQERGYGAATTLSEILASIPAITTSEAAATQETDIAEAEAAKAAAETEAEAYRAQMANAATGKEEEERRGKAGGGR